MRVSSLGREIGLGLVVYSVYLLVRRLVLRADGRARARRNGEQLVELEERLGIHVEPALQRAVLRAPRLVHGLNVGYGLFNVTLTVGWLAVLYHRGDPEYYRLRWACVLAHLGAQPVFLAFPTAPLSEVSGFDLEHPLLARFYNPVAAMPSLHVAFATLTGSAIAARVRSPAAKALAHAYAPVVSLVVAATGNHYVLDAFAGAALGCVAKRVA